VEFETSADLKSAVEKLDGREFKGVTVHCTADVSSSSSELIKLILSRFKTNVRMLVLIVSDLLRVVATMSTTIVVVLLRLLVAGVLVATVNAHPVVAHLHQRMTTTLEMVMDDALLPREASTAHPLDATMIPTMLAELLHLLVGDIRTRMLAAAIPTHVLAALLEAMATAPATVVTTIDDIRSTTRTNQCPLNPPVCGVSARV
jgi:hypothetical protein